MSRRWPSVGSSSPRTTLNNTVDVAGRSFSAVLNHMTRTALAQADVGIAMGNAPDYLKDKADYVTDTVDQRSLPFVKINSNEQPT